LIYFSLDSVFIFPVTSLSFKVSFISGC